DDGRLAFGPVPPELWAPESGPEPPQEPPGLGETYLHGRPDTPLDAYQTEQFLRSFQAKAQAWQPFHLNAYLITSLVSVDGDPVAGALRRAARARGLMQPLRPPARPWLRSRASYGPPAAPVLGVRHARRAVAAVPSDDASYDKLADAVRAL